jgi:hypothetical protein
MVNYFSAANVKNLLGALFTIENMIKLINSMLHRCFDLYLVLAQILHLLWGL